MYILKTLALFICAVLTFSESKFVDTLIKCGIKDEECQATRFTTSFQAMQEKGAPELDIPPLDPIEFKNISIILLDMIDFTVKEGKVKGLRNCVVEKFKTNIEKGHANMRLSCNSLTIKSKYKMSGTGSLLKSLFGGESVHGEGNGKLKLEKLILQFDFFYTMEKNKDGDVFFNWNPSETYYTYEILGKTSFDADSIFLGETDATKVVVGFMNENSKFMISSFGKTIVDKAMEILFTFTHKFFSTVPAKYFIIEDLSQYVKE